jgi:hypothetical protein
MTTSSKRTFQKNNSLAPEDNALVVTDRPPLMMPSSSENEQALLGALLIGEKEIGFEVYPLVRADDFYFHSPGLKPSPFRRIASARVLV